MVKRQGLSRWSMVATVALVVSTFQILSISVQTPANAAQADLAVSMEAAGVDAPPSTFTDLITENFTNISSIAAGTSLAVGTVVGMAGQTITAQSGGTSSAPTSTTYSVASTSLSTHDAAWYGGAGGTGKFASVTTSNSATSIVGAFAIDLPDISGVSPADDTYRYVGFWWSGGNSPNIVRLVNNNVVEATFTTVNLLAQLGTAPNPRADNDYFGNPNTQFNSDDNSCPSGNTCGQAGGWEPYAFIHLRLSTGFDQIQFAGKGFEFDSISIRRFVPPSSDGETSIVGSGVVSSCSSFSNENAQYVLRNGSFEDDYITNANGSTTATISSVTTSDTTTDIAKWVRYSGGPYQFSNFFDADSGNANRIPFWRTSASDSRIELQRQVSGSESSAARNGSLYFDLFGPRPADGNVHAEINANERAALFQDIVTIGGQKITWSIKHRGRYFGSASTTQPSSTDSNDRDKFEILIGPSSGTLVAQTPARKQLPNVVWNSANAAYGTNAFTTFSTNTSGHTASTMYTRLEDGWVLYTGTYTVPSGQTSTRFSFSSRGTGTLGNLIDDIGFDPIMACPRSVTIQRSQTVAFPVSPLENSQIPGYTYPDTTQVTSVSINGGVGTASLNTADDVITLSSDTVGTYQVLYTLTDINNQTSTSTISVNVEDATSQLPNVLLVDPHETGIALPAQTLAGSTNAMLCIEQVADADGEDFVGTPTIALSRSAPTVAAPRTSFNAVTLATATNLWRFTGSRANLQAEIPFINVTGTGSNPLAPTDSKFFRMGITATTAMGGTACFVGGQDFVVEIRSLELQGSVTRRVEISN